MAEFYTIDPETCSIEELESNISNLEGLSEYWDSFQLAAKLIINSMYGCMASKFFFMHNLNVAEAITLQGQNLNHFSEAAINKYINEIFRNDEEMHQKLGIDFAKSKFLAKGASHGKGGWACGGDTDSLYIELGPLLKNYDIKKDKAVDFCMKFNSLGLDPYLKKCYVSYAKAFNCDENVQVFELEKIARTCLYYAKKKYSMEVCWEEPGIVLDPMSHVIFKGLEVIQGSTPKYARECQIDFIRFVEQTYYDKEEKPSYTECISKLREYKSKMKLQDPNDICKGQNIGDYDKFILDDKASLKVGLHCPIHVKAAAIGNWMLYKNKKYLTKYSILKTSSKCKFYYTKNPDLEVFGFEPNKFPSEYAPEIDYDMQFEKTIGDPCNRLIHDVLKYNQVNSQLTYSNALF